MVGIYLPISKHNQKVNMETIKIKLDKDRFARQGGVDENDNHFIDFEVDYFADQDTGECSICGKELESGFICLDGGEEFCSDHIIFVDKF